MERLVDAIIEFLVMAVVICVLGFGLYVLYGSDDSKGNGRCVQEDSYMGENVVTCEPVE